MIRPVFGVVLAAVLAVGADAPLQPLMTRAALMASTETAAVDSFETRNGIHHSFWVQARGPPWIPSHLDRGPSTVRSGQRSLTLFDLPLTPGSLVTTRSTYCGFA